MSSQIAASAPLDIALLAPLVSPIRQPYLGGAQALLRDLAVGLAARGHAVTLYASQGSDPDILPGVTLIELVVDQSRVRPTDFAALEAHQPPAPVDPAVEEAFERAIERIAAHKPQHQLAHAHAYDEPAFRLAQRLPMPVAHTLHMSAVDPSVLRTLASLAPANADRTADQPWLVTVSQSAAATYRDACRIDAVIYNGLDVATIPFGLTPAPEAYALYAGRITPEKGVEDAIHIALKARMRLFLVGGIYDQRYYDTRIAPLLSLHPTQLTYLGPQPREEVWRLMSGARAVIVPSLWDEPFGLAPCEAQAAGAPVVGYESGGLREVVAQGETGALVPRGDIAEAAHALSNIAHFSRSACRLRVENLFSLDATIAAYEAFYQRMLTAS
ncbi:MAG TPA: glycosyltransferase [Ktedonobacterales bacterium]|jgi:glycosyltransferase involved in cell wall biosynthesis|nr:glycosyltransferase [Ktedonobacterales bacterium]